MSIARFMTSALLLGGLAGCGGTVTATPDVGGNADTNARDGSTVDAAAPDAGVDATVRDASAVDAGTDAARSDSGTDAARSDAGFDAAIDANCDADGDGHRATGACGGDDCNDGDAAIHPGAPEACDGVDSNCALSDALDAEARSGCFLHECIVDHCERAVAIATDDSATCAALSTPRIACWGRGANGQFIGEYISTLTPVIHDLPGGLRAVQIVGGGGSPSLCYRDEHGLVRCAGYDQSGELGDGDPGASMDDTADPVMGLAASVDDVAANGGSAVALAGGRVYQWGNGLDLATGLWTPHAVAAIVPGITTAIDVSTAHYTNCALLADHTVRCWGIGDPARGDGVDGTVTLATVSLVNDATALSMGRYYFGCVLRTNGHVACWGDASTAATTRLALDVDGVENVIEIAAGLSHACAIVTGGHVLCWGANERGQLGDGSGGAGALHRTTAVMVAGIDDAVHLGDGYDHMCAIRGDGSVWCWGANTHGQIGDGTMTDALTPVAVVP